jgi:DNA-binding response OmpR family regulator
MKNSVLPSVAIVDDDELYRKILRYLLKKDNFDLAFEANNGLECIEKMQEADQLPNLVVLDIEMPLLNGYQTAMEIKNRWPGIPILFHSSVNSPADKVKMAAVGVDHFLIKGDRSLNIVDTIRYILDIEG